MPLTAAEVAAKAGCSQSRVYEVVRASDELAAVAPGQYGMADAIE